ncbi:hypothetical protein CDD83_3834 [Cordyceps sp. RAO-2017]|nr:hypothetical protein CDD83_3834 [Cordyceps sp. RAO-2017]
MPDEAAAAAAPFRVLCPALGLVPAQTPPGLYEAAVRHFAAVPWCAALLSPAADGAEPAIAFVPQCFNPAPGGGEDQFVGATLARAPGALLQMLCLFRPDDAAHVRDPARPIGRVSTLYALGDGLSGYRGILHGGVVATLMDETLGIVHELNAVLGKAGAAPAGATNVTARLAVSFRRPVPVPGHVRVTAWVCAVDGRKTRMACEVAGPDGTVMAEAESVWVMVGPKM